MYRLLFFFLLFSLPIEASSSQDPKELPEACLFVPPKGWGAADLSEFPEGLKAMVVGKGKGPYPPSINLWIEPYLGTQKNYMKSIKEICHADKEEFRDLGEIKTEAGTALLCQVDRRTKWGNERQLHALIVRYDKAYLLTAAALKDEFADHYAEFFKAIRSMNINKGVYEQITSLDRRCKLQAEVLKVKQNEESLDAFVAYIDDHFSDMGSAWKTHLLEKITP